MVCLILTHSVIRIYQNISEVLLTSAFILWPPCTCGFGIREKIRCGLQFFGVFLCGFAVFGAPLRPPPLTPVPPVIARDEPWPFTSGVIAFDHNFHHLRLTSAGGEYLSNNTVADRDKTLPQITKHFHKSQNTSTNSRHFHKFQNTCTNPKHLHKSQNTSTNSTNVFVQVFCDLCKCFVFVQVFWNLWKRFVIVQVFCDLWKCFGFVQVFCPNEPPYSCPRCYLVYRE